MKPVKVIVDNRIRIRRKVLSSEMLKDLQREFTYKNPQWGFLRAIGKSVWGVPSTIKSFKNEGPYITFSRGGLHKVREIFEDGEIPYRTIDRRTEGVPCLNFPKYIGHPFRYYQEEGAQAALKKENCIIRAPTASGKSLLVMGLIARIKLNALVILPTVALFKQWIKDAKKSLDMGRAGIGIIHGKKKVLRPITVAVQKSLDGKITQEMLDFFGIIVVDEVQKSPADSYVRVIDPWTARYRIGVSASEKRKDKKEFLTKDLFGEVAYEIKRSKLEEEGFVHDVQIRVVPTEFEAPWYGMPDQDLELDFVRLVEEMSADAKRAQLALRFAFEEIRNGNQALVLTHRRENCRDIDQHFVKQRIPTGFLIGGADYAKQFEQTVAGIEDKSLKAGIGTYQALGFGINLPSVAVGFGMTPIASNEQNFNQARGRFSRLAKGKSGSRFYYLWDRLVYPDHLINLVKWNPSVVVWKDGEWQTPEKYLGRKIRHNRRR